MKSLRIKISLIILFVMVISFISVGFIAIRSARSSLESEMTTSLVESVHSTADAVNAANEKEYKMLETLAALPEIKTSDVSLLDKAHTIYGAMSTNKDYIDVCILDTAGFAWINNGAKKIPFSERRYFQEPFRTGKRFETDPFINKVTNAPALFYSVPVHDENNKIINVIFCVIDGLNMTRLVSNHKAGNNRPAFLITLNEGQGGENEAYSEIHSKGIIIAEEEMLSEDYILEQYTTKNFFDIEKNSKQDEESIKLENTLMEYILDGLSEKKKYDFHFDFGEDENNKLLNNKEDQEKFHKKLKKKLNLEYNIPEKKIIITNPQKGSYQISIIFIDEAFNTNIDANELKEKFKNDKDFKEISYLKKIHKTLIMEGCKLSINMLDSRGNKKNGWSQGQKRGGFDYYPPIKGWIGFGLKVLDKYDNGNNDWIANNGNKNEWAVAYHGTGVKMGSSFTLEKATNCILEGGFKAGWGQAYAECEDARHPGQKVGVGVYCSPDPYVMESYARYAQTSTCINGINFMMGFMMRVKPERIRYSNSQKDYWVLNGTTDEMRPYRIMVKAHGVNDEYLTYITVENRRNNIGDIFHFKIMGSRSGTVWGDHIYSDDSNIAKAAVIEGLCKIGEEKEVSIKMVEPQSSYASCFKNGIQSYWYGSYIFV